MSWQILLCNVFFGKQTAFYTTHTYAHTQTLSLSLSHTHTHSFTLTCSHTHTMFSSCLFHVIVLSFSISLSLIHQMICAWAKFQNKELRWSKAVYVSFRGSYGHSLLTLCQARKMSVPSFIAAVPNLGYPYPQRYVKNLKGYARISSV